MSEPRQCKQARPEGSFITAVVHATQATDRHTPQRPPSLLSHRGRESRAHVKKRHKVHLQSKNETLEAELLGSPLPPNIKERSIGFTA